jgi:WD40 repeat protein
VARVVIPLFVLGLAGAVFGQSLEPVATLKASTGVRFTAVSPDGGQIAAACEDGKLRLFTLPEGKLARTLDPGEMKVGSLAYSRNGRRLAAGGPGAAQVFDTESGQRVAQISGVGARVDYVALSPDGRLLAVAPIDLPAQLWDVAQPKRLASLETRFSGSTGLAFSPDGTVLAAINADTTVRLFAAATGRPVWTFDELDLEPFTLDFTPDSKTLVVGGADKIVVAVDAATGKSTHRMPRQPDPIGSLTVLGNAKTVIAACINADKMAETRAILAWDLPTGAVKTLGQGQSFNGGAVVADGRLLLTAPGKDGLELWAVR